VADAARCWVPCVDSLWERCTWELILSVPRILSYEQETDQGIEVEEFPIVCVASGELVEQVKQT
jgi:transcription initiation factor TFIID subunit 2